MFFSIVEIILFFTSSIGKMYINAKCRRAKDTRIKDKIYMKILAVNFIGKGIIQKTICFI
ncbi:hypothetical protein MASR1M68_15080 [Elusimicrobiota bacterium]